MKYLLQPGRALRAACVAGTAALAALGFATDASAQVVVNGSVGGQVAPGVYGRIDFGNAPAPAVIYPQPVIIAPRPVAAPPMAPVYYNVPPGHAKKWHKHCHKYNACGVPVYFVRTPEYKGRYWREHEGHEYEHGHGHGKGRGHGRD